MRTLFRYGTVVLLALLLLPNGCRKPRDQLPFYQLVYGAEPTLTVDGVQYISDINIVNVQFFKPGVWKFTGETGEVIGVCGGRDAERGGGDDVLSVVGDGERQFLYVKPNHFVFGPYIEYFFFREGTAPEPPSAETVGSFTFSMEDLAGETADTALIAALLDLYFSNDGDVVPYSNIGEDAVDLTLTLYHQAYPFLSAEIKGAYSEAAEAVYLTCVDGHRRRLPSELAAQLLDISGGERAGMG